MKSIAEAILDMSKFHYDGAHVDVTANYNDLRYTLLRHSRQYDISST